jgi:hypothetical protein
MRAAGKTLADAGFLVLDSAGKRSVSLRPPGVPSKIRLYEVLGTILGAGGELDIEHNRPE